MKVMRFENARVVLAGQVLLTERFPCAGAATFAAG
jgi:hypothetical protein